MFWSFVSEWHSHFEIEKKTINQWSVSTYEAKTFAVELVTKYNWKLKMFFSEYLKSCVFCLDEHVIVYNSKVSLLASESDGGGILPERKKRTQIFSDKKAEPSSNDSVQSDDPAGSEAQREAEIPHWVMSWWWTAGLDGWGWAGLDGRPDCAPGGREACRKGAGTRGQTKTQRHYTRTQV